jgi:hypothetical protein
MVGIYADGKTSITAGCYSSEQTDKVMEKQLVKIQLLVFVTLMILQLSLTVTVPGKIFFSC